MQKSYLSLEHIGTQPWGAAYRRELDLMIAANVLASLISQRPLYNQNFDRAAAERLMPLDGEFEPMQLPTVNVPVDAERQDVRIADAKQEILQGRPRGHWAVFRLGDRYDAYVSNGLDSVFGETGEQFTSKSETAPRFTTTTMYAAIISMMTYLHRTTIQNRIIAHTVSAAGLLPGREVKNVNFNGKTFSTVTYDSVKPGYYSGGGDVYRVIGRRRGAKPTAYLVGPETLQHLFDLTYKLPPDLVDPENDQRVISIVRPLANAA